MTDLLTRWLRLLPGSAAAFADLAAHYGEPGRHYHTLDHIRAVLDRIDALWPDAPPALLLAAWLHDVVYDSRAADNEERSADYARAILPALGVPPGAVDETARLILLTRSTRPTPATAPAARSSTPTSPSSPPTGRPTTPTPPPSAASTPGCRRPTTAPAGVASWSDSSSGRGSTSRWRWRRPSRGRATICGGRSGGWGREGWDESPAFRAGIRKIAPILLAARRPSDILLLSPPSERSVGIGSGVVPGRSYSFPEGTRSWRRV